MRIAEKRRSDLLVHRIDRATCRVMALVGSTVSVLRVEVIVNNIAELRCGKRLAIGGMSS